MDATFTQPMADHRTAAKATLAAIIFASGVALGAVVGTAVAPVASPVPVSFQALDPDTAGFRLHRNSEISLGGATTNALREQRDGEINVGAGSADNALRAQRRGEMDAGQP